MDVKLVSWNKEIVMKAAPWHEGTWIPVLVDGKSTSIRPRPKMGPAHSHALPGPPPSHSKREIIAKTSQVTVSTPENEYPPEGMKST